MTIQADLRTLCHALGFMTVLIKDDLAGHDNAKIALRLAELIEEFCTIQKALSRKKIEGDRFRVHQNMAATIVTLTQQIGHCTPKDLKGHDFTEEEIDRCWPMAKALAGVMMGEKKV